MKLSAFISTHLILLFLLGYGTRLEACGISTHIEIGHMAATIYQDHHHNSQSYKQLILKHQDAYQAGNTYPDTYYSSLCFNGKYHQTSEDSHWTAFTNVTLQYIRDNFPPPWSNETEKLVVFMLGFVSHQVADITWHSLGITQGFIRTMAAVDFHGVYDDSHTVADIGGDIINEFRGDYSYVSYDQWYIPVTHLANIYNLYYGTATMTEDIIEECTSLIFLAVLGEKLALGELYTNTAAKSPFLTQNLDSFFLGGMYDMALWTTNIWDNVIYLLEHGFTGNCETPDNPLYIRCKNPSEDLSHFLRKKVGYSGRVKLREPSSRWLIQKTKNTIVKERTEYGVIFRPSASANQEFTVSRKKRSIKQKMSSRVRSKASRSPNAVSEATRSPNTVISTRRPYARLGHVTLSADVNNDNINDLIISSPMFSLNSSTDYEGRVFVVYGTHLGIPQGDFDVEQLANVTLHGPEGSAGRFGSAVAILDVNLDGFNDIVVSSPNLGWSNLTYTGGISIWFGNQSGGFQEIPSLVHTDSKAPLYNNEGMTLISEDIDGDGNDDLVIGSPLTPGPAGPQSGKVCVMKSSRGFNFDVYKCISGPGLAATTSWFGSSMLVSGVAGLSRVLIISSPLYRKCHLPTCRFSVNDTQSVGAITIWSLPHLNLLTQINGPLSEHAHFGSSLALGYPYGNHNGAAVLAVGMDSLDTNGSLFGYDVSIKQAGAVALYNLSTLLQSKNATPFAILYGDRDFSMFGSASKFADMDGDGKEELIVGAPHYTDDPTELLYGAEQGIFFVFGADGFNFNDADVNVCNGSYIRPCPSKVAAHILSWFENKAHIGSEIAVLKGFSQADVKLQFRLFVAHTVLGILVLSLFSEL